MINPAIMSVFRTVYSDTLNIPADNILEYSELINKNESFWNNKRYIISIYLLSESSVVFSQKKEYNEQTKETTENISRTLSAKFDVTLLLYESSIKASKTEDYNMIQSFQNAFMSEYARELIKKQNMHLTRVYNSLGIALQMYNNSNKKDLLRYKYTYNIEYTTKQKKILDNYNKINILNLQNYPLY